MEPVHLELPYHSENPDIYCQTEAAINHIGEQYQAGGRGPLILSIPQACSIIQQPIEAVIVETGRSFHGRDGDYLVVGVRPRDRAHAAQRLYFFMKVQRVNYETGPERAAPETHTASIRPMAEGTG